MIKIFNPNDTDFSSNGNIFIKPLKCIERKAKSLNGWNLSIEVDIRYKDYIKKDYLVVVKTKSLLNPQAFRIGDSIEYVSNRIIFTADHVYYDSNNYFLLDVRPTKLNAIAAMEYVNERTDEISPFSVYSDIDSISTSYFIRKSLLEAWSIFEERYSGYFQFDNWNINLKQNISVETGIIISYAQYLEGINIIEDWSSVVTKLYPVGNNGIMLDEKYLESDIQYDVPYTKTITFTSDLETDEQTDETLKKELKEKATTYLNNNKYPKISYEVRSNINQNLDIGNKVQIKHPLVDIDVEVIEYEYDIIQERTISLVFGNFSRSVKKKFDAIKQEITSQAEKISNQEQVLAEQTELINNLNKKGYVYIDDNEILILDKLPKEEAKNIWRWGLGGLAFSSKGYKGPFSTAITQDGKINADFIATGKINTNLIEGYEQLILKVDSNIEKTGTLEANLSSTNKTVADNKASFENFKNNEYIQSIDNLQNQIDGAIQFWNGAVIPTLNNYPANEWTTEADKNNHRADIYIVVKDVEGELKQGKGYRFDKVGDNWKWIELTDNELSAVQAIAEDAKKQAQENANSIKTLQDKNVEIDISIDGIKNSVSNAETQIQDITTTTQTSIGGNSLYLTDALESNAIEYKIEGKCEQETRSGKNLYNFKDTTNVGGGITTDENGWITITADNTSGTSIMFRNYFTKNLNLKTNTNYAIIMEVKNVSTTGASTIYATSVLDNTEGQFVSSISYALSSLSNNTIKIGTKSTKSSFTNISQGVRTFLLIGAGVKSTITFRLSVLEDTTITANTFKYEAYGASPSPDYPSEINTVKGVRNLFDKSQITSDWRGVNTLDELDTGIKVTCIEAGTYRYSVIPIQNSDNLLGKEINISANISYSSKQSTQIVLYFVNLSTSTLGSVITGSGIITGGYVNITTTIPNSYPSGMTGIALLLYSGVSSVSIGDYCEFTNIMLEEGSITHPYVPFGTYEKIKITGKNVFNIQKWLNATLSVVHGVLNSKTSNGISLTATANDCYTETFSMSQITNKTAIDKFGFEIEGNTDYTFYTKKSDTIGGINYVFYFDKDYKYISLKSNNSITNENFLNFTTPPNAKYICLRLGITKSGDTVEFSNIMLLKGTITTTPDYELYKEQEVLVDMNKPNLCNPNELEIISGYVTGEKKIIVDNVNANGFIYIPCESNNTYNVSKINNGVFRLGTCTSEPVNGGVLTNFINIPTNDSGIIKSGANDKFLIVYFWNTSSSIDKQEILDSIKIYEGYGDYYELSSINDTKDVLEVTSGLLDNKIGKVVLNGSESWMFNVSNSAFYITGNGYLTYENGGKCISTHFPYNYGLKDSIYIGNSNFIIIRDTRFTTVADFKAWLSENPVTVYYLLAEPQQIILPSVNVPLYKGINNISLVEDLETNTSIKYYRNTPIAQDYVIQQQLDKTNSNLSNTNQQLGQAQSDISSTNTNLNNNYYNKEQIDSMESNTSQNITQIKKSVETFTTSTEHQISVINETIANGVSKVVTTNTRFDENGMHMAKDGEEMSSTVDWDGLEVVRDKGKPTEEETLSARSDGVKMSNAEVKNYYVQKPSRQEKCVSVTDGKSVGIGTFWIGV